MKLLKNTNIIRRKVTKKLTKNLGKSASQQEIHTISKNEIKRVLICRPNHRLGNQLLISSLVEEVSNTFPECTIDLFVKGNVSDILYKNHKHIRHIIKLPKKHFKRLGAYFMAWFKVKTKSYDLVINAAGSSSSGRLATKITNSKYQFFNERSSELEQQFEDYNHIAKHAIYGLRAYLEQCGIKNEHAPIPNIDIKLSEEEINDAQKIIDGIVSNKEKDTIAIFTYATGAKCLPPSWWLPFLEQLESNFKDYNIIEILPVENVSQIDFKCPSFYSKDVREISAVIANTKVFIGADSGMMHLASASQTPTIGLFSVTNPVVYAPYRNNSMAVNLNTQSVSDLIKNINEIIN